MRLAPLKDIKRPDSAYQRLERSVRTIGDLSLMAASQQELQKAIKDHNDQRRVAAALTQMLKYFGRGDIVLHKNRQPRPNPKYLSLTELSKILPHLQCHIRGHGDVDKEYRALVQAAFASGMRQGELFAATPEGLRMGGQGYYVSEQMLWTKKIGETKTGDERMALILPELQRAFHDWLEVPVDLRKLMRNVDHCKIVTRACEKAFPDNERKHLVFHDLRHSYAKALGAQGESLSLIANSLGIGHSVCERYYKGFVLDPEGAKNVLDRWYGRSKKPTPD